MEMRRSRRVSFGDRGEGAQIKDFTGGRRERRVFPLPNIVTSAPSASALSHLGGKGSGVSGRQLRGRDGHAGTDTLETVNDDLIARLEAVTHDAFALDGAAEFHGAIDDRIVLPEREDELLVLIGAHGTVADE